MSDYLGAFSDLLVERLEEDEQYFIVTGGGEIARRYMSLVDKEGISQYSLDGIGILATRLNAFVVASYFGDLSNKEPFTTVEEAALLGELYPIVVGGGTVPGHSTDAVAALVAERVGGEVFLNLTTVDGVYERDPRKHPGAKMYRELNTEELLKLTMEKGFGAGGHMVIDPLAAIVIHRSSIRTVVMNGRDLENLRSFFEGKEFRGTVINPIEGGENG